MRDTQRQRQLHRPCRETAGSWRVLAAQAPRGEDARGGVGGARAGVQGRGPCCSPEIGLKQASCSSPAKKGKSAKNWARFPSGHLSEAPGQQTQLGTSLEAGKNQSSFITEIMKVSIFLPRGGAGSPCPGQMGRLCSRRVPGDSDAGTGWTRPEGWTVPALRIRPSAFTWDPRSPHSEPPPVTGQLWDHFVNETEWPGRSGVHTEAGADLRGERPLLCAVVFSP